MREKIERLVDDLDGGDADETVVFGLDGYVYEIDLSADNGDILRERLMEFINKGRRQGRMSTASGTARAAGITRAVRPRAASNGEASVASTIRGWGRDQNFEVNDRGRISKELRAAYDAAHVS